VVAEPPPTTSLDELASAAARCTGCELYRDATQTVFGEGPARARVMLVGEQPGDVEDRRGEPFVGPAGRILDKALAEAGLPRDDLYVTNAVKHFRFKSTAQNKRRLHQKPDAAQVSACRPWLAAELAAVRPDTVVLLGATAAQAVFGSSFRLTQHRGERLPWPTGGALPDMGATQVLATIHPSAILRAGESRQTMYAGLVHDLKLAASARS
jgi:uracil-DNA glycosylase